MLVNTTEKLEDYLNEHCTACNAKYKRSLPHIKSICSSQESMQFTPSGRSNFPAKAEMEKVELLLDLEGLTDRITPEQVFSEPSSTRKIFESLRIEPEHVTMATRMASPNQQRSRGAGGSSGHALRLPAHGQGVRNWLCSASGVLPNRTCRRSGQTHVQHGTGAELLVQRRQIISNCASMFRVKLVWWNMQAEEKMTDH